MENKNEQELQIEISPDKAAGSYSNLAIISHSPTEFVIDFVSMLPRIAKPSVQSRVIMTPENAKNLMFALMNNIKNYETTFGEIKRTVPVKRNNPDDPDSIPNPFMNGGKLN